MKSVKINRIELAFRDHGSGRPVVFLHAFPLSQKMWEAQVTTFSSDYRVVTFDWRGFGQSTLDDQPSTMEIFADDLAHLLRELSIDQAVICGVSMGGYAAFAFYRKYRKYVSALILSDTRSTPDKPEGRQARSELAGLARVKGPAAVVEAMLPKLIGETTLKHNPAVAERIKEIIESNQPEAMARALEGMAERRDSTDLLPKIDCPTLIIVGNEDKLTPPSDSEKMHQAVPGSSFRLIRDSGHLPNLEQPESFNRTVKDFLSRL